MALEVASRMAVNAPMLSQGITSAVPALLAKRSLFAARAASITAVRAQNPRRQFHLTPRSQAPNTGLLGISNSNVPSSYFQRPSLPANTVIRFVPQQTAWIVERM